MSKNKVGLLVLGIFFISITIIFINRPRYDIPSYPDAETVFQGIILHGYNSPGWIKNTTQEEVRTEQYNLSWNYGEKHLIECFILKPGEQKMFNYIYSSHGYEIFHQEKLLRIGWLKPKKPDEEGTDG